MQFRRVLFLFLLLFLLSQPIFSNPIENGLKRTRKRSLSEDIMNPQDFWGKFSPTNSGTPLVPFCKVLFWQNTGAGATTILLNKEYPATVAAQRLIDFPGSCYGFCPCANFTDPICDLQIFNLGNLSAIIDASNTIQSGGPLTLVTFNPGDGSPLITTPGSPLIVSHTYGMEGIFNVTLTATDINNGSCSVSEFANITELCPPGSNQTVPGLCGCDFPDSYNGTACNTGVPGACAIGEILCNGMNATCIQTVFPTAENCSDPTGDFNCNGFPGCEDMACFLNPVCVNGTIDTCFFDLSPP